MRILMLLSIALALPSCHRAAAQSPEPPAKMTLLDAANLRAVVAEENNLTTQYRVAMEPLEKAKADICARNKIDPTQLGKTIGIDFATGEIQRAAK